MTDAFAERLARVRQRFVSTLQDKIDGAGAALPNLANLAPAAAAAVGETYRSIHGLVGVGPTVGFPETGRAARLAEDVLRPAQHDARGLTADEVRLFGRRLQELRDIAKRELQTAAEPAL